MIPFPKRGEVYIGTTDTNAVHVVGWQFGPCLLAVRCDLAETLSEFDERHGQRVEDDPAALADIGGIEAGLASGDIRVTDGGTAVFVDPYEWAKFFPDMRAAKAWLREAGYGGRE